MQLTQFSDYSLRLLLYLAAHPDRLVPIDEVSRAYGVSHHHLVKIVQLLVDRKLVASTRGRGGGLRLNRAAGRDQRRRAGAGHRAAFRSRRVLRSDDEHVSD